MGNGDMENISDIIDKRIHDADTAQNYSNIVNEIQRIVIIKALERSGGNQIRASKMLGLHRNTLSSKIKKFSIDIGRFKK